MKKCITVPANNPHVESLLLFVLGHQKQVGPESFRVFYTIWKETEAEAQEVCMFVLLMRYNLKAQILNIKYWHMDCSFIHIHSIQARVWGWHFLCLQEHKRVHR